MCEANVLATPARIASLRKIFWVKQVYAGEEVEKFGDKAILEL